MDGRPTRHAVRRGALVVAPVLAAVVLLASCQGSDPARAPAALPDPQGPGTQGDDGDGDPSTDPSDRPEHRPVTLAFAGDVHFPLQLEAVLEEGGATVGPMARALRSADLAMVNLESAVTERGTPEAKELERPDARYWFRTTPAALDVLARSGVDVVSVANNHGADYGPQGLADTLRAARRASLALVGAGRDRDAAFAPYVASIGDARVAVLGADASRLEDRSPVWRAGPDSPGLAAARGPRPRHLVAAVRRAADSADVVVVYLHWGEEYAGCPSPLQRSAAAALAEAGADVVVGSHAHVLLGAGMLGDTYVDYGLGNFFWYHGGQESTGVLRLRVDDGRVVADDWVPGRIPTFGGPPRLLGGEARERAVAHWRRLRGCTDLAPVPGTRSRGDGAGGRGAALPAYSSTIRGIGPTLRRRMASSHGRGCPVPWADLRHLRMTHVGFDGRAHSGEMVVHEDHARDVVGVFRRLYDARWPIRRMRLVSDYGGDDDRSMAADNTSGYNCRRVAGQPHWSDHAFGAAVDLNPVENPYVTGPRVQPPAGRRFASLDRRPRARVPAGVIRSGDVVHRAFTAIGWEWGGTWSATPDYQHFSAP
jgi:poly-gamma-glutamate synthesis protein (capsule biosynthesis protein)